LVGLIDDCLMFGVRRLGAIEEVPYVELNDHRFTASLAFIFIGYTLPIRLADSSRRFFSPIWLH
jgi:hypothetical protein